MRLFRIRMGFPAILFGSLLLILAGSSGMAYLQILSKGLFRWMALTAVAAMALFYLPRAGLALNRLTPVHWGWMAFLALATATAPLSGHPNFALLNCVAVSVLFVAAFGTVWYFTSDGRSVVSLIEVVHRLAILVLVLGVLFIAMPKTTGEEAPQEETMEQGGGRFEGFFNNPNWNGIFSAMVLPIMLWKVRYPAESRRKAHQYCTRRRTRVEHPGFGLERFYRRRRRGLRFSAMASGPRETDAIRFVDRCVAGPNPSYGSGTRVSGEPRHDPCAHGQSRDADPQDRNVGTGLADDS